MKIVLLSVGKINEPFLQAGIAEMQKRLRRYVRLAWEQVADEPLPRKGRTQDAAQAIAREGERLLRALDKLPPGHRLIALAIEGRPLSSEELADYWAQQAVAGCDTLVFVIGGTLGLDPRVIRRADLLWSLSRATFPHTWVPLLVLEQLYRAARINRGEPYHY